MTGYDATKSGDVRAVGDTTAINVAVVDASGNQVTSFGGGGGGGGGGGSEYAEDSVFVDGSYTVLAGVVRRDTAASGVNASGDVDTLSTDSLGRLRVFSSVQGIFTEGSALSTPLPVLTGGKDTSGNLRSLQCDADGILNVNISSGGGGGGSTPNYELATTLPSDADAVIAGVVAKEDFGEEDAVPGEVTTLKTDSHSQLWVRDGYARSLLEQIVNWINNGASVYSGSTYVNGGTINAVVDSGSVNAYISGTIPAVGGQINTNDHVSLTDAAALVISTSTRTQVILTKHDSTVVWLGGSSGVTSSNGFRWAGDAGDRLSLITSGEIWAILSTGTATISYFSVGV